MVIGVYCSQSSLLLLVLSPWVGLPGMHLTWLSGLQSVYERQGIAVMTPTVPGSPKGPFLGLPRGTMRRQKSIGKKRDPHPKTLPLSSEMSPQLLRSSGLLTPVLTVALAPRTLTTPHWDCLSGGKCPTSLLPGSPLNILGYKPSFGWFL